MRTISRPLAALSTRNAMGAVASWRSRSSSPRLTRMWAALGESWRPAPGASSCSACSSTTTRKPFCASASAAVSPPIPAPATITVRGDVRTRPPAESSDDGVVQFAFRRPRRVRRQRGVVAIERRAIRADMLDVVAHIAIDVRMIEWRHGADAHKFLGADLDDRNAEVIVKMRNDRVGHAGIRFAGRHHSGGDYGFLAASRPLIVKKSRKSRAL